MLGMTKSLWFEFLRALKKITTAARCLEEFQCSNAAQVVTMWAWTIYVASPVDHDAWMVIESEMLRLYQTHGTAQSYPRTTYCRYDRGGECLLLAQ